MKWRSFGFSFEGKWSQKLEDSDYDSILLLHEKMCTRLGKTLDLPDPRVRPTMICMVGEKDGRVTHFVTGEAEMEISAGGEGPMTALDLAPVVKEFRRVARFYQIRIVRAFVPRHLLTKPNGKPAAIARLLKSKIVEFTQDNDYLAPFFYWVKPEDEVV